MPPPKRTQAQRRANTERRVLDAAIDLMPAMVAAVSLAQIGEAAGYSRGIVTHNFGSREKLLDAVLRDAQTFHVPDNAKDGLDWLAAPFALTSRTREARSRNQSVPADVG